MKSINMKQSKGVAFVFLLIALYVLVLLAGVALSAWLVLSEVVPVEQINYGLMLTLLLASIITMIVVVTQLQCKFVYLLYFYAGQLLIFMLFGVLVFDGTFMSVLPTILPGFAGAGGVFILCSRKKSKLKYKIPKRRNSNVVQNL